MRLFIREINFLSFLRKSSRKMTTEISRKIKSSPKCYENFHNSAKFGKFGKIEVTNHILFPSGFSILKIPLLCLCCVCVCVCVTGTRDSKCDMFLSIQMILSCCDRQT